MIARKVLPKTAMTREEQRELAASLRDQIYPPWSEAETERLKLALSSGEDAKDIAAELGRSYADLLVRAE